MTACNLGCSSTGCQITEIAQNQPLIFNFSQDIDPATINAASVSIRTAQGEEPVGVRQVVGGRIEFLPEVQLVGGTSFFGFKASETYVLTLQGGRENINAIRGTSGDPLVKSITCTLNVSRGIVDLDGRAPSARLVVPSVSSNVSVNSEVVIEFSELIDTAPFSGTTTEDGPVRIRMRRTQVGATGELECNPPGSESVTVLGSPRVSLDPLRNITVLSFVPATPFPGEVCVEVEVTSAVRDLAGTPAATQFVRFITETRPSVVVAVEEDFLDDSKLDRGASAGSWAGGQAEFGPLGGSGVLGVFDVTNGSNVSGEIYVWDTESSLIPGAQTTTGNNIVVTDGVYDFSDFVLEAGKTLRFIGSHPVVIRSSGRLEVHGTIEAIGRSPNGGFNGSLSVIDRVGAEGGPGGGAGGNGAVSGNGTSHLPGNNGRPGATVQVDAGHAFASAVANTGGAGAQQFPLDGRNTSLVFVSFLTQMVAAGGGGGGYVGPGAVGEALANNRGSTNPAWLGPPSAAGVAFDVTGPLTKPAGVASLDHYLVGGAGGGGGASHALFTNSFFPNWYEGCGGGGGGGAVALRAGDLLLVSSTGSILAWGGKGNDYIRPAGAPTVNVPSPGGGGSGGSVLLQSARVADIQGTVNVLGGAGGLLDLTGSTYSAVTQGGDGADGYIRLEVPGAASGNPVQLLPLAQPAATALNLGELTDEDATTSFTSTWYFTGQLFGPRFLRYEIEATVDGVPTVFSDDPAVSAVAALPGVAPINAQWQAAQLDPNTLQPQFGVDKPFRNLIGRASNPAELTVADDGLNGFRFKIALDRSFGQEVIVTKVSVYYQF